MKFRPLSLGIALGILWGAALFFMTWLCYVTGWYGRLFLEFVGSVYPGYTISPLGSLVGLGYGFADMFVAGVVIGWLYNRLGGEEKP